MGIYLQWQAKGKSLQCVVTNMENEEQNNRTNFSFLFFLLLDTQLMLFSYGEFQMLKLNPSEMVIICGDREKAKATTTTNNCIVPLRSMWCSSH